MNKGHRNHTFFIKNYKKNIFPPTNTSPPIYYFWLTNQGTNCTSKYTPREKCPNTEFFLVRIFSCLDWIWRDTVSFRSQSEYRKIRTIKNSVSGHFSYSYIKMCKSNPLVMWICENRFYSNNPMFLEFLLEQKILILK